MRRSAREPLVEIGTCRYRDSRLGREMVILLPGHLYVTRSPVYISTVLGTCIAVCLFDRRRRIGGMNHFLLPEPDHRRLLPGAALCRYGRQAMRELLLTMQFNGADVSDLEAKVFGGARVNGDRNGIGPANRDHACAFLERSGIPVVAEDTGGERARQVLFDPVLGHVRVRKQRVRPIPARAEDEARFLEEALRPDALAAGLAGRPVRS